MSGWNHLIRSMQEEAWVHDLESLEPGSVLAPLEPNLEPDRWRVRSSWAHQLTDLLEGLPLAEYHADRALRHLLADDMLAFRLMEAAADRYRNPTESAFQDAGMPGEWAILPMALTGWDNAYYGPGRRAGPWAMDLPSALYHGLEIRRGWDERHLPEKMTPAAVAHARQATLAFPDLPLHQVICFVRGRRAAEKLDLEALDSGLLEWLHLLRVILQVDRNFNRDDMQSLWLLREKRMVRTTCPEGDLFFSQLPCEGEQRLSIRHENPWYTTDSVAFTEDRPLLLMPPSAMTADGPPAMPCGIRPERNRPIPTVRYVVRPGDVLGTIAREHGVRIDEIRHHNQLEGDVIRVGQLLEIPGAVQRHQEPTVPVETNEDSGPWIWHTVKEGESYWTISRQYAHAGFDDVMRMNVVPPAGLKPGMKVKIPPP